jgi:hypothetical protein
MVCLEKEIILFFHTFRWSYDDCERMNSKFKTICGTNNKKNPSLEMMENLKFCVFGMSPIN